MGASLEANARIGEQLANARGNVLIFRFLGTKYYRVVTLLSTESRTQSSAQLYVFDSDIEA
jgi:hypothetical protein